MTISKSGLENERKGKMKETEGGFRGDLGRATGDTSEPGKDRAEEAKGMSDPSGATQGKAEVFERLKQDISRRLTDVCSGWSEADKEATVDRIARTALRYPEIRDDPRFSR
jgi:hypothetical protein